MLRGKFKYINIRRYINLDLLNLVHVMCVCTPGRSATASYAVPRYIAYLIYLGMYPHRYYTCVHIPRYVLSLVESTEASTVSLFIYKTCKNTEEG